jgi:hypothetical protein
MPVGDKGAPVPNMQIKRKVYFAFRFKDIMRVNNVRQAGKIGQDQEKNPRDFYDRSIWEQSSRTDPDGLKRLMREAVEHSSVVCVLVGTGTWDSRWVKYEIARSVIDQKGLLAVGINGLSHTGSQTTHPAGFNPLDVMGVYDGGNGRFYLAEKRWVPSINNSAVYEWRWFKYDDHLSPNPLPAYLKAKPSPQVTSLSEGAALYDYVQNSGYQNLGAWIDAAAAQVGR